MGYSELKIDEPSEESIRFALNQTNYKNKSKEGQFKSKYGRLQGVLKGLN